MNQPWYWLDPARNALKFTPAAVSLTVPAVLSSSAANRNPPRRPPVYVLAAVTVRLICDPLSFVNAPLLVVRNLSASLVEIRTVFEVGVELDTVMYGVPPTSLPKSRTTAAGVPPDVVVRTVVPVACPVRTPAL